MWRWVWTGMVGFWSIWLIRSPPRGGGRDGMRARRSLRSAVGIPGVILTDEGIPLVRLASLRLACQFLLGGNK